MALDKAETRKQLDRLWKDKSVDVLEAKGHKYAIISDTHMGDGGEADDFYKNEPALLNALDHYRKEGHILILLGDVEELWQFDLEKIVKRYNSTVYEKIRAFGDNRVQIDRLAVDVLCRKAGHLAALLGQRPSGRRAQRNYQQQAQHLLFA